MNEVIIRKADLKDLDDILKLNQQLFLYEQENFNQNLKVDWPYTENGINYFQDMIQNKVVYVLCDGNQIVGYLAGNFNVKPSYIKNSYAEIDNIYILDHYQKKGFGSKLIRSFQNDCQKMGVNEIHVTANSKNQMALSFYLKNEFENFEITLKCSIK